MFEPTLHPVVIKTETEQLTVTQRLLQRTVSAATCSEGVCCVENQADSTRVPQRQSRQNCPAPAASSRRRSRRVGPASSAIRRS